MAKHCKGCSHPTICKTHGCAATEARRNKSHKPHAAADSGALPPPDIRLEGLADYYRSDTVLMLLENEKLAQKKALQAAKAVARQPRPTKQV